MPQPPDGPLVYRFADWELRVGERRLLLRGEPAKIGRPAFNLLLALIKGHGHVVSKDALLAATWPRRVVEENNLSVQVTALRKLLGPKVIVNAQGLGYRLAATPLDPRRAPAAAGDGHELLGRAADIDALAGLLEQAQLVTIVGTGGVGKTALARAVMARTQDRWPDGVHWLDLAPLRSGEALPHLLGKALGLLGEPFGGPSEDLALALAQRRPLVVLDNCEHLLAEVAAFVDALLRRAPGIAWLATSQQPLQLTGESVYRLTPLALPAPGAALDEALASGALALFCERARQADRRFELRADRLHAAIDLCHRLDGLPLAIEMAAARVAALGLQALHDQIDQRLRLRAPTHDAPPRQATLTQTYDWSYGLLSALEQRVFRRLEPFAGGFTLAMAQRLCADVEADGGGTALDAWDVHEALGALVQKSLLQRSPPGPPGAAERLHLLESARDYARLQLEAAGETARTRRRHALIVAEAFATAHDDIERWRDEDWSAKYLVERSNVGVALAWACSAGEPAALARLVAALGQLDRFSRPQSEVVHHPVPLDLLFQASPAQRAPACAELGWLHFLDGSVDLGDQLLRRALADYEALGDTAGRYSTLTRLVRVCRGRSGRDDEARALWARLRRIDEQQVPLRMRLTCSITVAFHYEGGRSVEQLRQLLHVARRAGYQTLAAGCQLNIIDELTLHGRYQEAADAAHEEPEGSEAVRPLTALIRHNQALALVRLGRFDEADAAAQAAIRMRPSASHLVMDLYAHMAARGGRHQDAALLAGRSAQLKRERHWTPEPAEARLIADTDALLRKRLGAERLAALADIGAAMPSADVLALARSQD